jgi:biotin transporter BioY
MVNLDMSFGNAIAGGVVPFVFWDVLKALAAGLILPAAWKMRGGSV